MLFNLVYRRLKPRWPLVAVVAAAQVGQTIAALSLPSLNADIIDQGVAQGDTAYIWRTGGVMLAVSAAQMLGAALATFVAARLATDLGAELRQAQFLQVQGFGTQEVRLFGPPSLITRATNDVNQVQTITFMTFSLMIMAPIMGVGGVIMAIRQDATLSWLLVVVVPVLAALVGVLMYFLRPLFMRQQRRIDRLSTVMREQLSGVRVIRAARRQDHMESRFTGANDQLKRVALTIGNLFSLMFPLVQLVIGASTVAVIWFGGHLIDSGDMQIGSLIAFLSYLMQILMAVMMAAMMFVMVPRAEVSATRISEILDTRPAIAAPATPSHLGEGPLNWRLEQVEVRFPGATEAVFSQVDLEFLAGSVTGIIGSTGAGKTTLANLLVRQLDPSGGRVSASGIDLRDVDPGELRERVGLVPQKTYLFSGTVASTVTGQDCLDETENDRLTWALRLAQAEDFVAKLEGGHQHPVQPGGTNFSGGQRQRLAIARALYKRCDLLILDDSCSALDYATDARLRAALRADAELQSRTLVIVAQRVSTIRHADTIVVLDAGAVVGRGTHDELMASCQTYREIVASQLSEEEAA